MDPHRGHKRPEDVPVQGAGTVAEAEEQVYPRTRNPQDRPELISLPCIPTQLVGLPVASCNYACR